MGADLIFYQQDLDRRNRKVYDKYLNKIESRVAKWKRRGRREKESHDYMMDIERDLEEMRNALHRIN